MVTPGFVDPVNQALFNPRKKKTRFPGKRSRDVRAGTVDVLNSALLDRGSLWTVGSLDFGCVEVSFVGLAEQWVWLCWQCVPCCGHFR